MELTALPDLQEQHLTNVPKKDRIRATRLGYRPFLSARAGAVGFLSITQHRYTQWVYTYVGVSLLGPKCVGGEYLNESCNIIY